MIAHEADIPTADGTMNAYVACPDSGGPFPLVVVFMDIWGLREELFAITRRIAAQGYYAVLPNLYYRRGRIAYERRNAAGQMVSFDTLPADLQAEMLAIGRGISRDMLRSDLAGILDYCRHEPVAGGPAGSVGFCLGGRMAFIAGQEFPERFRATGSLHGTLLVTDAPQSPHRFAQRMRGEVYCGHAEHDKSSAPPVMAGLAQVLGHRDDVAYSYNLHPGAHHGYSLPDRDVHDSAAAEADWRAVFAMFDRQLKRAAASVSADN